MKTLVATVALATFLTVDSRADLSFSAPGMESHGTLYSNVSSPVPDGGNTSSSTVDLESYWKYEITGFRWALTAGSPIEGIVRNGGHLAYTDGSDFVGDSSISVTINGTSVVLSKHNVYLDASNISDENSGYVELSSPIVITDGEPIQIVFSQTSDMKGDTGSYIILEGYGLKEAPSPTGEVVATSVVDVNTEHSVVSYTLVRPLGIEETLDFSVENANFTTTSLDSGHGNNADGIDSDNKGKAASVWSKRGGNIEIIAEENIAETTAGTGDTDEGGGTGSVISNNK